jgi:hypothetical protein
MGRTRRPAADDESTAIYRKLLAESLAYRGRVAARYGPVVSAFLRSLPLGTIAEKRQAVRVVNGRLRSLGLAIRCPRTGLPARLVAHPGNHPETPRRAPPHCQYARSATT